MNQVESLISKIKVQIIKQILYINSAAFKEIDRTAKIDLQSIHDACIELFAHFNSKIIEALGKCMKTSLDILKTRETTSRWVIYIYIT